MKAPTENEVRNAIAEYLLYRGWLVMRINSGVAQPERESGERGFIPFNRWQVLGDDEHMAGVSDLIAFHPYHSPLAVETKRPGNKATKAQKLFLAAWAEHGGVWCVAESVEDVQMALSE